MTIKDTLLYVSPVPEGEIAPAWRLVWRLVWPNISGPRSPA
jgi:hypothetical protein